MRVQDPSHRWETKIKIGISNSKKQSNKIQAKEATKTNTRF